MLLYCMLSINYLFFQDFHLYNINIYYLDNYILELNYHLQNILLFLSNLKHNFLNLNIFFLFLGILCNYYYHLFLLYCIFCNLNGIYILYFVMYHYKNTHQEYQYSIQNHHKQYNLHKLLHLLDMYVFLLLLYH